MSDRKMTSANEPSQSRTAKWGWGILLVVSALLVLNGAFLFFYEQEGQTLWIVLASFGLLALVVSVEGFRHGSRWAWNALWVLVGMLAVVGVRALVGGESFGLWYLFIAAMGLVGQLLASRGLVP
jgi:hypothetical protein